MRFSGLGIILVMLDLMFDVFVTRYTTNGFSDIENLSSILVVKKNLLFNAFI